MNGSGERGENGRGELRVILYCNGVEELNLDLSSDCAYGYWERVWRTKPVRVKFNSKDTASDSYSLSFGKNDGLIDSRELLVNYHYQITSLFFKSIGRIGKYLYKLSNRTKLF